MGSKSLSVSADDKALRAKSPTAAGGAGSEREEQKICCDVKQTAKHKIYILYIWFNFNHC